MRVRFSGSEVVGVSCGFCSQTTYVRTVQHFSGLSSSTVIRDDDTSHAARESSVGSAIFKLEFF